MLILTGEGASFSAGADMNWMRSMAEGSEADNRADARALAAMLRKLDQLPCPTLADIDGDPDLELVLQDINFSRRTTGEEGLELLAEIKRRRPEVPVILITAWGSIELAVRGMKAGAAEFVLKSQPAFVGNTLVTSLLVWLQGQLESDHVFPDYLERASATPDYPQLTRQAADLHQQISESVIQHEPLLILVARKRP